MYSTLFRLLPGPTWFRWLICLVLVTFVVWVLFKWAFPWAQEYLNLSDMSVE